VDGIVKLSEFDQKLGNTRIHNSLIVQHSGYWPELENSPIRLKLTIPFIEPLHKFPVLWFMRIIGGQIDH